ncbi:MAG: MATE family efflux transporter, partial [Lachnospiraceae bacterium]
ISSFIVQFAVVIIIVITNNLLIVYGAKSVYGPEIPLTALGVTMKINNILIGLMCGIGAGALPIIGYNYGAGNVDRIKKTIKLAILSATICGAIATVFFQLFPEQIVAIFGAESELYTDFGIKCLRIFLMLCTLDGLNNVVPTCFQAVNKPGYSVAASVMRQLGFNVPPAILFARLIGVTGILWGGPVCATLSFILNIFLLRSVLKRLDRGVAI